MNMKEENIHDSICFCGHDCSVCMVYLSTVRDDAFLRSEACEFYRKEFGIVLSESDIRCFGGRQNDSSLLFKLCADCPFRKCCLERGIHSCRECPEYPCAALDDYSKKYVNKCGQIKEEN